MARQAIKSPGIKLNAIDRAINWAFPVIGAKRIRARLGIQIAKNMGYITGYGGASTSKQSMRGWNVGEGDSDSDDLDNLPVLRGRSRDSYRNNPIACGLIRRSVTNAIGSGLHLQSRIDREILGIDDKSAEVWEKNAETRFRAWAESKFCDITGKLNFYEMQGLSLRNTMMSGDIFTLLPLVFEQQRNIVGSLRLAIYEADFVCNPNNAMDTYRTAGGVTVDDYGAPAKYHFRNGHPGGLSIEKSFTSYEVQAFGVNSGRRNVIHLFNMERPHQRRGVPFLANVMEPLKGMSRLSEANLMKAVVQSFFTVFVETQTPTAASPLAEALSDTEKVTNQNNPADANLMEMGYGNICAALPGESIKPVSAPNPDNGFDGFFKAYCMQVGAAAEIPYEQVVMLFNSSYSASRAALLEAWKFFKGRRVFIAVNFCKPIYEEWLLQEVLSGRIAAPGFLEDTLKRWAWCGSVWNGPGQGQINPVDETNAAILQIGNNLADYESKYNEINGGDWDSAMNRKARQEGHLKRLGLRVGALTTVVPKGEPAPGDGPGQDMPAEPPASGTEE